MPFPYTGFTYSDGIANQFSAARANELDAGIRLAGVQGLGSSPPGSPVDGMIWRYPVSAATGTYWLFQYDSSQTTYKWVNIGGAPLEVDGTPNAVANTKTQVAATNYWYDATSMSVTLARGGDYLVNGWLSADANGAATANASLAVWSGTTAPVSSSRRDFPVLLGNPANGMTTSGKISALAASTLAGIAFSSGAVGSHKLNTAHLQIVPVRVI